MSVLCSTAARLSWLAYLRREFRDGDRKGEEEGERKKERK